MGGHIKTDPAIDRWVTMKTNAYQHFKWTPRTTRLSVIAYIVVPAALATLSWVSTDKYDWTAIPKDGSFRRSEQVKKDE